MPALTTSRRAFSLLELSIVLGVVGIILAAVWGFAEQAYESQKRERAEEEIFTVVNNVRAANTGQTGIIGTFTALTPQLALQNAIPRDMLVNTSACTGPANQSGCIANGPWGPGGGTGANLPNGSFGICNWAGSVNANTNTCANNSSSANSYQLFAIELQGMKTDSCISIATNVSSSKGPPGLIDVAINGVSFMAGSGITYTFPILVSDANTKCAAIPNGQTGATLDFVYRLRASAF